MLLLYHTVGLPPRHTRIYSMHRLYGCMRQHHSDSSVPVASCRMRQDCHILFAKHITVSNLRFDRALSLRCSWLAFLSPQKRDRSHVNNNDVVLLLLRCHVRAVFAAPRGVHATPPVTGTTSTLVFYSYLYLRYQNKHPLDYHRRSHR